MSWAKKNDDAQKSADLRLTNIYFLKEVLPLMRDAFTFTTTTIEMWLHFSELPSDSQLIPTSLETMVILFWSATGAIYQEILLSAHILSATHTLLSFTK